MKSKYKFKKEQKKVRKALPLLSYSPAVVLMVIFPQNDNDRDNYYNQSFAYLSVTGNATRLEIDAGKMTVLEDLLGPPPTVTGPPPGTNGEVDTWNFVWPLVKNKDTATTPLRTKKNLLIKDINAAFNDVYSDIPDSAITVDDTATLGIRAKKDRKDPTLLPPQITAEDELFGNAVPQGGGDLLLICRSKHDSKKASKLRRDVDIEVVYGFVEHNAASLTREQCTNHMIVTKARSLHHLDPSLIGKKVCGYARWYYSKHPERSGQFSNLITCIVT